MVLVRRITMGCLRFKRKVLYLTLLCCLAVLTVLLSSCAGVEPDKGNNKEKSEEKVVNIVYVKWSSEIASTHVVKAVIEEKLNYKCELMPVTLTSAWESIAVGDMDAMVSAWLPLQSSYYEEYGDRVVNLGPNLEPTQKGLVVPEYVNINSIEELKHHPDKFGNKIIGIDPEAGVMIKTSQVIEEYNLDDLKLVSGSDSTMTTALANAIKDRRWIVVTGWTPHWKFAQWDLKYLKEPKNIYKEGHIDTIVRKGLKEDMPEVYSFLDNFKWSADDMSQVMLMINQDGTTPQKAAEQWISKNERLVEEWVNE